MNIYIGNLPDQLSEAEVRQMFEAFGTVESVKIVKNRFSGDSKGFGFVEMPSNAEADQAIKALNGKIVQRKPIKVNHADPGGKKKKKKFKKRRY